MSDTVTFQARQIKTLKRRVDELERAISTFVREQEWADKSWKEQSHIKRLFDIACEMEKKALPPETKRTGNVKRCPGFKSKGYTVKWDDTFSHYSIFDCRGCYLTSTATTGEARDFIAN